MDVSSNLHLKTIKGDDKEEKRCSICNGVGWICTGDNTWRRCRCHELENINKLWLSFGVNPKTVKKINDYKVYNTATNWAKEAATLYVEQFENIKKNKENGLLFMGQSGAGKSHLIIAVGAELLNKGKKVVYMPYLESMREIKGCVLDKEKYSKITNRYKTAEVLIIDDLFKDKINNGQLFTDRNGQIIGLTESDMRHLYPIINYRYFNGLPILISTECNPEMLLKLDEALAGRILEVAVSHGALFNKECNYRLKSFYGENIRG